MGFVISFILVLFAILSFGRERRIYAPGFLFSLFWGLLVLLASLRLNGLYETSYEAYFYILLGVLSYLSGCQVAKVGGG